MQCKYINIFVCDKPLGVRSTDGKYYVRGGKHRKHCHLMARFLNFLNVSYGEIIKSKANFQ